MRVFVAGATGVIGRSLTGLLMQAGHQVTGMTRSPARARDLRARGADAVVCDAFDAAGLRESYAPCGGWVKDEEAPLNLDAPAPMGEPIAAIADLERQVLEAGGIVLRYGFLYGPGTQLATDGLYAALARKRRLPVVGSGEGRWSFIHVEDAASATLAALQRGNSGVYNVVDDDPSPAGEWLPHFAAALGAKRPLRAPAWIARLVAGPAAVAGMTTQRAASNAKARRELAWQPEHSSWRDGFRAAG